jgi:ketosteroid isomerase-like protein
MEHPSEEARKKYLQEHPGADPHNHTVQKTQEQHQKETADSGLQMLHQKYDTISRALGKGRQLLDLTQREDGSFELQAITSDTYKKKPSGSAAQRKLEKDVLQEAQKALGERESQFDFEVTSGDKNVVTVVVKPKPSKGVKQDVPKTKAPAMFRNKQEFAKLPEEVQQAATSLAPALKEMSTKRKFTPEISTHPGGDLKLHLTFKNSESRMLSDHASLMAKKLESAAGAGSRVEVKSNETGYAVFLVHVQKNR